MADPRPRARRLTWLLLALTLLASCRRCTACLDSQREIVSLVGGVPLTKGAARKWAEEHGQPFVVERKHSGGVESLGAVKGPAAVLVLPLIPFALATQKDWDEVTLDVDGRPFVLRYDTATVIIGGATAEKDSYVTFERLLLRELGHDYLLRTSRRPLQSKSPLAGDPAAPAQPISVGSQVELAPLYEAELAEQKGARSRGRLVAEAAAVVPEQVRTLVSTFVGSPGEAEAVAPFFDKLCTGHGPVPTLFGPAVTAWLDKSKPTDEGVVHALDCAQPGARSPEVDRLLELLPEVACRTAARDALQHLERWAEPEPTASKAHRAPPSDKALAAPTPRAGTVWASLPLEACTAQAPGSGLVKVLLGRPVTEAGLLRSSDDEHAAKKLTRRLTPDVPMHRRALLRAARFEPLSVRPHLRALADSDLAPGPEELEGLAAIYSHHGWTSGQRDRLQLAAALELMKRRTGPAPVEARERLESARSLKGPYLGEIHTGLAVLGFSDHLAPAVAALAAKRPPPAIPDAITPQVAADSKEVGLILYGLHLLGCSPAQIRQGLNQAPPLMACAGQVAAVDAGPRRTAP